jgi:uncharacterized Rmd1/YagE family protein
MEEFQYMAHEFFLWHTCLTNIKNKTIISNSNTTKTKEILGAGVAQSV